jgi:hypothetical protein
MAAAAEVAGWTGARSIDVPSDWLRTDEKSGDALSVNAMLARPSVRPARNEQPAADAAGSIPGEPESARRADGPRLSKRSRTVPDLGFVLLTVLLFGALMLAIKGAERL